MLLILPQEKTWPSVGSMAKGQLDSEIVVFLGVSMRAFRAESQTVEVDLVLI